MSVGYLFLDTTKSWLHSDLFTAIFLFSPSSRAFSPDCRMCDENWLRYLVLVEEMITSLIHKLQIDWRVRLSACEYSDRELKLVLADFLAKWYFARKLVQVLVCHVCLWTQHDTVAYSRTDVDRIKPHNFSPTENSEKIGS